MEPRAALARVIGVRVHRGGIAALYAETWAPLVGLLVSIGGSRADAEEVAQEAFEKLVRSWPKVSRYDDPSAWVRQVAVRTLISRHRRATVATAARGRLAESAWTPGHADRSDSRMDLDEAMARLPVEQRAVVLLHYVHDLPVAGIAQ